MRSLRPPAPRPSKYHLPGMPPPHSTVAARTPLLSRALVPNWLTGMRLALAAAFLAALSVYRYPDLNAWALPVGLVLFIVAAATDVLDGYLARRWGATSVFGRVMDPFADKVLVMGAFIMLAGPAFTAPTDDARRHWMNVAGVAPWMVAVILARELLVTSIRGVFEAGAVSFPANWWGKVKMIVQSGAVPVILFMVWTAGRAQLETGWRRWTIDGVVWLTVIATVASGWPYLARAFAARHVILEGAGRSGDAE